MYNVFRLPKMTGGKRVVKKIRTMLCDDYKYICEYFKSSLSEYDDIDVVAVANSSEEALQMIAVHKPDVAILDIRLKANARGLSLFPKASHFLRKQKLLFSQSTKSPSLYMRQQFSEQSDIFSNQLRLTKWLKVSEAFITKKMYSHHLYWKSSQMKVVHHTCSGIRFFIQFRF